MQVMCYGCLVPRKNYDMYCAVARALEVLGERWTLLVVRELMTGPKRFADLQSGLPGIATNILTERLRTLVDEGVVERRTLPRPAVTQVYELTDRGRELKPVLLALAGWGAPKLGLPREGEQFRLAWLMIALDLSYDPVGAPDPVTVTLNVGDERLSIRAHGKSHSVTDEIYEGADLVVQGSTATFLGWATGSLDEREALAAGLTVTKGVGGLRALRRLYPVPG